MDSLEIKFILPSKYSDDSDVSDIMIQAYEACKQYVKKVSWLKESSSVEIESLKTNVVIFEEFKGKLFDSLKDSKCVVVGPWCVLVCLTAAKSIPNFPWPIYNVAMYNCIVSTSHLSTAKKEEIKEKVQLMGGCYAENLLTTNTHLITDSVQSEKYVKSAEAGIKLMLHQWVEAVWNASQDADIHCDNDEFNRYRCLPFHNLTICATGIKNTKQRTELCKIITSNGGVFSGNLHLSNTQVLVCYGTESLTTAKYKAARNVPNIQCVTMDWIKDSVEKGYALPCHLYYVKPPTSTPKKLHGNPNFSVMSAIAPLGVSLKSTYDETVNNFSTLSNIPSNKRKYSLKEDVIQLIDELDIKKAKRAGQYLDGCSVYLAGFDLEQREKLCKVLNLSGATRYDDISERLTHIIVGDPTTSDINIIRSKNILCPLVTVYWLIESMNQQHPMDEEQFLISLTAIENNSNRDEFNSPLSQRGLNLLRSNVDSIRTITDQSNENTFISTKSFRNECDEGEDHIMKQYLQQENNESDTLVQLLKKAPNNLTEQEKDANVNQETFNDGGDESLSECNNIFKGYKFLLYNFESEKHMALKQDIELAGGEIVSDSDTNLDFAVLPIFNLSLVTQYKAKSSVNSLWIEECIEENEICKINYYHRPFTILNTKPLENCVITISSYCNFERQFLKDLIQVLGGKCQDHFARVTSVKKNVIGSTHLISLEASGKKYLAALKWGLPVINKDWLLECAKTGKLVDVHNYLVGDAKAPIQHNTDIVSNSFETKSSDLENLKMARNENISVNLSKAGCSKSNINQLTPLSNRNSASSSSAVSSDQDKTPIRPNNNWINVCSQVTPVSKIMAEIRSSNILGTPENSKNTPETPIRPPWHDIKTPEEPLGRFLTPNPSPNLKKSLQYFINQLPDFVPKKPSTPLSEMKRRFWSRLLPKSVENSPVETYEKILDEDKEKENEENKEETNIDSQNLLINQQLKKIEDMLTSSTSNRRSSTNFQTMAHMAGEAAKKESQPFTVGWDYMDQDHQEKQPENQLRIFMISGINNDLRQSIVRNLESLGATVSDLINYDPSCTHLICPRPARNEKILSCMAAGKWILHVSYVDKCIEAGCFLNEEEFEFGNPKSSMNISFDSDNEQRMQSLHWWRKEIKRRGYGAFNDMRAIVVAAKREPIIRVIEAGGGVVVDARPPFDDDTIHATHCLLEPKHVTEFSDYLPLAQQGIYCVNTLYISDFLHRTSKDIRDCVLPYFAKYYNHN